MRLPLSKVYRAFPELDRFSDEQCAEYVRQIKRRFRASRLLMIAGCIFLSCILGPLGLGGGVALVESISPTLPAGASGFLTHPLPYAIFLAVPTAAVPALIVLTIRNVWLRRRLREHMGEIRCVNCKYLLLRLVVRNGVVTCPECGTDVVLASLGLTAADIMSEEQNTPVPGVSPAGSPDTPPTAPASPATMA